MNYRNFQFSHSAARTFVAATIVTALFFTAAPANAAGGSNENRIEARITDIHNKLKITTAEEGQWAKVAQIMRDNDKKMDELTDARMANAKNMNAVDDLKSYGDIVDEHADGIRRFTPAFAKLYADMPVSQKVKADNLFHHEGDHKNRHHKV
jgi:periplasmic protein CpxP/Spy